jgi:hypothetical protein
VADIVEYLSSLTLGQLTNMLQEMETVLEYNYRLFNSQAFLDSAWKELTNNLKVAVELAPMLQDDPAVRGTRRLR